jgi:hypothetical protein
LQKRAKMLLKSFLKLFFILFLCDATFPLSPLTKDKIFIAFDKTTTSSVNLKAFAKSQQKTSMLVKT